MKRRVITVTLAILVAGLVLFVPSDNAISIADTTIPTNEVTSSVNKVSNCSASAVIVITMTGVALTSE